MRASTTLWSWPLVKPLRQSSPRERDQYQASPVASVLASASAFMCATISTSPVSASAATAVTRPSGPKRGASTSPSSSSCLDAATGKGSAGIGGPLNQTPGFLGRAPQLPPGGKAVKPWGARARTGAYPLQDAENSSWNAPSGL